MKNYSVLILILSVCLLAGCFRPPEFPDEPEIEFEDIVFKPGAEVDTLLLSINFQDGDGDLGLSGLEDEFPYHPFDIVVDSNGDTVFFRDGFRQYNNSTKVAVPPFYRVSPDNTSELLSTTDNRPESFTCQSFEFLTQEVERTTVVNGEEITTTDEIPVDSIYIVPNPSHNNFYVEFERKVNGQYVLFDFRNVARNDFCGDDFNGRFPIFDQINFEEGNALAGTIEYNMFSIGFDLAFRRDTFRINATIRDRALNLSNTVSTPDFTLESITRD